MGKKIVFKMGIIWCSKYAFFLKLMAKFGEKDLKTFDKLDCDITPQHIELYHRISSARDTVTAKCSWRKECQQIWHDKKAFKKLFCSSKVKTYRALVKFIVFAFIEMKKND